MTIDRYTKAVLTVIAVALAVIAFRETAPRAGAQGMGDGCGSTVRTACFVQTMLPIDVRVQN